MNLYFFVIYTEKKRLVMLWNYLFCDLMFYDKYWINDLDYNLDVDNCSWSKYQLAYSAILEVLELLASLIKHHSWGNFKGLNFEQDQEWKIVRFMHFKYHWVRGFRQDLSIQKRLDISKADITFLDSALHKFETKEVSYDCFWTE